MRALVSRARENETAHLCVRRPNLVRSALLAVLGAWCLAWGSGLAAAAPGSSQGPADELVQPVLTNEVELEYPPELAATDDPPSGRILVKYVVDTSGIPKEVEVVEGLDPVLDARAIEAVSRLRYEPATYRGNPVEIVLSLGLDISSPTKQVDPDPESTEGKGSGEGSETQPDAPPPPIRISGRILEAGLRNPLAGASVLAIPAGDLKVGEIKRRIYGEQGEPAWTVRAFADNDGNFELRGVPDGRVRLIFLAQGFERFEYVVELPPDEQLEVKYFLRRLVNNPYRTEVEAQREEMPEVTSRPISREELSKVPGTQGDALKALQNFPGVARQPFGIGGLAIRGSAPGDSAIYLGYHEIPTLFHFGGLTSVFNSDILSQIDFIPGNFDSRYGDATGGVVNVVPRKGSREGYHGYIDADLFDAGALVEGPVGKGSFILSLRRSYIDAILPAVIPAEANLNFILAPRYWDYQALFDYPISGGEFSVRVFGSDDRQTLLFGASNDIEDETRDQLETTQWFHRVDLQYRKTDGPWEYLITPSYKRELFELNFGFTNVKIDFDTYTNRMEITRRLTRRLRLRIGSQNSVSYARVNVTADGFGDGEPTATRVNAASLNAALYTTLTWGLTEKLTLYPGVRWELYGMPVNRSAVDPRLRAAWQVADKTTIKAGVGQYSQAPGLVERSEAFGNPKLRGERSLQTSLGVAQQLPWDTSIEVTGFYKHLWDLVTPSTLLTPVDGGIGSENFANQGLGRIYGMEVLLRKNLSKNFFGWASYTLSRSERKARPGADWVLFDFDQTHILTLIASYMFPYNWQVGGRFRLVSGNPTTDFRGSVYDASSGNYNCISDDVNGARLPPFHQLDLRVDKTWIYKRIKTTFYMDVQNIYNATNVEFRNFSYNCQEYVPIQGLPITPSVGTRIEF